MDKLRAFDDRGFGNIAHYWLARDVGDGDRKVLRFQLFCFLRGAGDLPYLAFDGGGEVRRGAGIHDVAFFEHADVFADALDIVLEKANKEASPCVF